MAKSETGKTERSTNNGPTKVAVGCQGGGMHAAFEVGVLSEILKDVEQKKFELVGLSGTSAGALCALMVWYGLAPKNGGPAQLVQAIDKLDHFWNGLRCQNGRRDVLNFFTYGAFRAEEKEIPVLGVNAPVFWHQSVWRNLQGGRCLPAELLAYASNILIWTRCLPRLAPSSTTLNGKGKDPPADRCLGGRQRLRDRVRLRRQ